MAGFNLGANAGDDLPRGLQPRHGELSGMVQELRARRSKLAHPRGKGPAGAGPLGANVEKVEIAYMRVA
jgi:hypothetical protein